MANTQDENEMGESYNEGNIDMLPQPEDRLTIRNLLNPSNTEPSPLSGFAVNICTSVLGEKHTHTHTQIFLVADAEHPPMTSLYGFTFFPPAGVLVCVFCIVAVQGGWAPWSLSVLSVILVVCLILTFIVWRQPQSKAKLAFKVECVPSPRSFLTLMTSERDKRVV